MSYIYKVTNLKNKKVYIGKSKYNSPKYFGSGLKITAAIKKYGVENFEKTILEECNDAEVSSREIFWISFYNSCDDTIGYNISKGGTGGSHYWSTLSPEKRKEHNEKISQSKIGKPHRPHSEETKQKMSASFKNLVLRDPEFIKRRAALKRKKYYCLNFSKRELYLVNDLRDFCLKHNLDFESMRHNARSGKKLCNKDWLCSSKNYDGLSTDQIIKEIIESYLKLNSEFRNKIRRAKLKNEKL